MRRFLLTLAGCVLLALSPMSTTSATAAPAAGPSSDQLLAKTSSCHQISNGKYSHDEGGAATVPVCQVW